MKSLQELRSENQSLYNDLITKCKWTLTYNGRVIAENNIAALQDISDEYDKTRIVFEAEVNGRKVIYLYNVNPAKEVFNKIYEGWTAEKFIANPVCFNSAMNTAYRLPEFNILNEENAGDEWVYIKKYGSNFKRIIENLYIK